MVVIIIIFKLHSSLALAPDYEIRANVAFEAKGAEYCILASGLATWSLQRICHFLSGIRNQSGMYLRCKPILLCCAIKLQAIIMEWNHQSQ